MATKNVFVKDPNQPAEFKTQKDFDDFVKCCDPVNGYMYFMENFFWIQHPLRGSIVYKPYEYQKRLIYTYHNYKRVVCMASRQLGKTISAAGYLLWYAMFVPDSTVLIAAHKFAGAQEIMQRVRYAYESCPNHIKAGVVTYNKQSIDFDNGSRIVAQATTENTGRGMSISLLFSDEFAFVRPSIENQFLSSIAPTLATGGKAIFTSTPNGDQNAFARLWFGANKTIDEYGNDTDVGINGYKAFQARWQEHPERDQAWADKMRAELGDVKYRIEIECEMVSDEETLIDPLFLPLLEERSPMETIDHVRWYKKPTKGNLYTVSLDPSLGTGGDPAAIQIFEANTTTQVGEWTHNKTKIQEQIRILAKICNYVSDLTDSESVYYSVENNSIGEAALVALNNYGESNIRATFLSERGKKRKGFNTSNKSKLTACSKFKHLIETKKMTVYSRGLISEMKNFIANSGSYAAKVGTTDDLVMATLLNISMMNMLSDFSFEINKHMRDADEVVEPMPFFMTMSSRVY